MRTAIISDIHGHHAGLITVLNDIDKSRCDRIICLGDIVDGGDKNEETVNEIRKRNMQCVKGNHDEFNDLKLTSDINNYLLSLPEEIIEQDVIYTHISTRANKRKIDSDIEAWNVFDETNYRITFIGHVHYPLVFGENNEDPFCARKYQFSYNENFELNSDDRYIICVGAVGYGRDMIGKIRYCIYDDFDNSIELRAIDGPLLSIDWRKLYFLRG